MELSRKYFSHALVLIDNAKETKSINNNVVRALWGLIKVCQTLKQKQMQKDASKADAKNLEVLQLAESRIKQIYSSQTDLDVNKMQMMNM